MNNRLINTKVAGGGGGCTDIVDNYDPFGGNGVALYQLNGDATDVSGNYDATFTNPSYTTGFFGQAANFDTTSRYITTPYSYNWSGAAWTLSFWAKVNAAQDRYIMGTSQENGLAISARSTGVLFLIGGGNVPISYNLGEWKHFVYTYDGINNVKAYGNGVQVANQTVSIINLSDAIVLGKYGVNSGSNTFFNGSIDQFRVFDTELTPLEVEALYTEELCICDGTVDTLQILGDTSCIATYQLDGNANDLSGNYSGTPTNVSYGVGEFDLAGVFSGSTSIINLPSLNSFFSTKRSYTVSLWIKSSSSSTGNNQIFTTYSSSNFPIFLVYDNGIIKNLVRFAGATSTATSTTNIKNGGWYHVVISLNSSTLNQTLYINAQSESSVGISSNAITTSIEGPGLAPGDWSVELDQVRIFNKALNQNDVDTLYAESACTKVCTGTTNTLDILGDGSCVATYPLDGSPADLSGNYNGVQTDVTYPQGYFDLAGSFNGSGSQVLVSSVSGFPSGNASRTISFWMNSSSYLDGGVLGYGAGANNQGFLFYVAGGNLIVTFYINDASVNYSLNTNQWYNIVATHDGSTFTVYVNGSSVYSAAKTLNTTATNFKIGGAPWNSGAEFFRGQIDQVRIFNKALSLAEVGILYNNETPCN